MIHACAQSINSAKQMFSAISEVPAFRLYMLPALCNVTMLHMGTEEAVDAWGGTSATAVAFYHLIFWTHGSPGSGIRAIYCF